MKKAFIFALVAITIFCSAVNTFAAIPETVMPMWENTRQINNDVMFNGTSGIADITVLGKSGTTQITGTLTVYVQTDNGWKEVDSTSGSSSSIYFSLTINFTGTPGAYYKSVIDATVKINGVSETVSSTAYQTCPVTPSN